MKKTSYPLFFCLLMAGFGQAAISVSLDLPASGNYATSTLVFTSITAGSVSTLDTSYSIAAISNDPGGFVGSNGNIVGIGSDNDAGTHFTTLEGPPSFLPPPLRSKCAFKALPPKENS